MIASAPAPVPIRVHRKTRLTVWLASCAVLLAVAAWAYHATRPVRPTPVGAAQGQPFDAKYQGGWWYWVERPKDAPARLVRARPGAKHDVASAHAIAAYEVDAKHILWASEDGGKWQVKSADLDGRGGGILWSGGSPPHGLRILGDLAYWLVTVPGPIGDAGPLPALAPRQQVVSARILGGSPTTVATLPEPDSGEVLGQHEGRVYVAAYHLGTPGSMVIYSVTPGRAAPARVAADLSEGQALLAADGGVYWLAPSQDSNSPGSEWCVRRVSADGQSETLSDWLPAGGRLYETDSGVRYVDGDYRTSIWPAGQHDAMPRPIYPPDGYLTIAVGGGEVLLRRVEPFTTQMPLYRIPLP